MLFVFLTKYKWFNFGAFYVQTKPENVLHNHGAEMAKKNPTVVLQFSDGNCNTLVLVYMSLSRLVVLDAFW